MATALDSLNDQLTALKLADNSAALGDAEAEELKKARALEKTALEAAIRDATQKQFRITEELAARETNWNKSIYEYRQARTDTEAELSGAELGLSVIDVLFTDIAAMVPAGGPDKVALEALQTVSTYDTETRALLDAADETSGRSINPDDAAETRNLRDLKQVLENRATLLEKARTELADFEKEVMEKRKAIGEHRVQLAALLKESRQAVGSSELLKALRAVLDGREVRHLLEPYHAADNSDGLETDAALTLKRTTLKTNITTALEVWIVALDAYLEARNIALESAARGAARVRVRSAALESALDLVV